MKTYFYIYSNIAIKETLYSEKKEHCVGEIVKGENPALTILPLNHGNTDHFHLCFDVLLKSLKYLFYFA